MTAAVDSAPPFTRLPPDPAAPSAAVYRLPPTATHPRPGDRRAYWWPAGPGAGGGVVCVAQGRRDHETYAVEEDVSAPFPARVWSLCRTTGDIGDFREGVYDVQLDPAGWSCSCGAHKVHGGCKHADAIRSIHADGGLG